MLGFTMLNWIILFQVSSRLELWAGELEHSELSNDMKEAETLLRLHSESVTHMQNTTFQVLQQGQELAQVTDSAVNIRTFSRHKKKQYRNQLRNRPRLHTVI